MVKVLPRLPSECKLIIFDENDRAPELEVRKEVIEKALHCLKYTCKNRFFAEIPINQNRIDQLPKAEQLHLLAEQIGKLMKLNS